MADQLLLDVLTGVMQGQTFAVPANSIFLVGRLPNCSLSIAEDLTVSRQHFRIEFRPPDCQLIHLSQSGGTLVNESPVSEVELKNGDEITFGTGNRLKVRFVQRTSRAELNTVTFDKVVTATIPSGWDLCHSSGEHPTVGEILKVLDCHGGIYSLIDLRRIGPESAAKLGETRPLFGWLPPELAALHSPVFVSSSNVSGLVEFVEAGWGKDGIVCFGSDLSEEELLAHWQSAIGAKGNEPGESMTAFFWPSLLELILTHQSSTQVKFLVSKLKWLLIESKEPICRWKLYCSEDYKGAITSAGLFNG